MSGWFSKLIGSASDAFATLGGDKKFLAAACAATANTAAASNGIDDDEKDAALKAMLESSVLKGNFTSSEIEDAFNMACARAGSRSGKLENNQAIEALASRAPAIKQAIFMMAADVADKSRTEEDIRNNTMPAAEDAVLTKIAQILGVDKKKLLDA